jgi:hypothetical protein
MRLLKAEYESGERVSPQRRGTARAASGDNSAIKTFASGLGATLTYGSDHFVWDGWRKPIPKIVCVPTHRAANHGTGNRH